MLEVGCGTGHWLALISSEKADEHLFLARVEPAAGLHLVTDLRLYATIGRLS